MIFLAVTVGVCWILAAICNAVMDVLSFRFKKSIFSDMNRNFWDPSRSWRNKYKNGFEAQGPKFFGSTTFLVFTTDAWHLFQFLCNSLIIVSIILVFATAFPYVEWWVNILVFIGLKVVWGSAFEFFWNNILRKHE